MPKFFISQNQQHDSKIIIQGTDVNHIKNVLRKKAGDKINICIKEIQTDCIAKIEKISDTEIICEIEKYEKKNTEPSIKVTIFQGLPKSDKMELIIQKAVELGVYEIYPVNMIRCVTKLKDENKKIERWNKISEVAAKQSGRNIIPKINNCINIKKICEMIPKYDIVMVAYEQEDKNTLKAELKKLQLKNNIQSAVIIGSEGGIDSKEVEMLQENGAKVITLGKRILRTETVALNVLSSIMYEFEQ